MRPLQALLGRLDQEEHQQSDGERAVAIRDYRRALDTYAGLNLKGRLVQSSMLTYARAILRLVHLEDTQGIKIDRCKHLKTMLEVLKEYQARAPLAPAALQELESMRGEARSCVP